MMNFMKSNGILHQTSVPFNPEQNGMAERMNRTIVEKARCLLIDSCLGKRFWAEAVNTAVYLINRTPCKGLKELVPVEAWSGKKPNLSHLKVFGCSAITHIPKQKRKKFDSKGKEVTFVGYTDHNQTYRFYDHKKDIVFKSRGAVFMENKFNKRSKET